MADNDVHPLRRGLILQTLAPQYPVLLLTAALEQRVVEYYPDDARALSRDLAYLEEKKLIQRVQRQIAGGIDASGYKLTADGVDVVEKRVKCVGVTFGASSA